MKADDEIRATALGDLEEADEDGDRCLEGTEVARGGRFIRWNLTRLPEEDKKQDYTDVMMQKIRGNVQTSFFILYAYAIRLRNTENGDKIVMWQNPYGSLWLNWIEEARPWLQVQEAARLEIEGGARPSAKWEFVVLKI